MYWTQLPPTVVSLITSWLVMTPENVTMTRPGLEKLLSVWVSLKPIYQYYCYWQLHSLVAIMCPGLSHPEYGHVKINGTAIGGTAYYSCNRGYYLVGYAYRKCLKHGGWDGKVPVCKRKCWHMRLCMSHSNYAVCIYSDQVCSTRCSQVWFSESFPLSFGWSSSLHLQTRIQACWKWHSQVLLWQELDWSCTHLCL